MLTHTVLRAHCKLHSCRGAGGLRAAVSLQKDVEGWALEVAASFTTSDRQLAFRFPRMWDRCRNEVCCTRPKCCVSWEGARRMSYMGEIDHLLVWTLLLSRGFFLHIGSIGRVPICLTRLGVKNVGRHNIWSGLPC